ncbi:MAG TPA: magnesium and cobalt transport protein CorA [Thermomicrobiales bacterium]|jgi:magnesium transporter|nr:magnesium and cobalt transport protein CorA [Thermomicrobiales bacterium]
MIADAAIYFGNRRNPTPVALDEMLDACRTLGGMAWIDLSMPTADELDALAAEFSLPALAVQDALAAHQRPKIERYDDQTFVVVKAARYVDDRELIELDELHLFVGQRFVISVRHGPRPLLDEVRQRVERDTGMVHDGPEDILYAILDQVVDDYAEAVRRISQDIDAIETLVFAPNADVTRRTYDLTREIIEFQRAVMAVPGIVASIQRAMERAGDDIELQRQFRDVHDHATRISEQVTGFRALLESLVAINLSIVGQRQNDEVRALTEASLRQNDEIRVLGETTLRQSEEVKKISAWAAILFAPTLIGTVYGMNFDHMPELHWTWGYPLAIGLMLLTGLLLFVLFRSRGWLTSTMSSTPVRERPDVE